MPYCVSIYGQASQSRRRWQRGEEGMEKRCEVMWMGNHIVTTVSRKKNNKMKNRRTLLKPWGGISLSVLAHQKHTFYMWNFHCDGGCVACVRCMICDVRYASECEPILSTKCSMALNHGLHYFIEKFSNREKLITREIIVPFLPRCNRKTTQSKRPHVSSSANGMAMAWCRYR